MSAIKVTKENFDELINSENTTLLDFYADWCGPCRMLGPVIEEIAEEKKDINVGKINVDANKELANKFSVRSIPTMIVFKNGKEIKRLVGFLPKEEILSKGKNSPFIGNSYYGFTRYTLVNGKIVYKK